MRRVHSLVCRMASSFPTAHTASTLERLRAGNRRYAAGTFSVRQVPHFGRPIAVVVCPPDWPIPPCELFGLAPEALYLQRQAHNPKQLLNPTPKNRGRFRAGLGVPLPWPCTEP